MARIQHVSRKNGTYYFRRVVRLESDKPFRVRFSLLTTDHDRARFLAPALTARSEALRMNMLKKLAHDGLTADQRIEIYKRQLMYERDRLVHLQVHLQFDDPERGDDILPEDVWRNRLEMIESIHLDRARNGDNGVSFITYVRPDANEPEGVYLELVYWEDYDNPLRYQSIIETAEEHLSKLGIPITKINRQIAIKVLHETTAIAAKEFRELLDNPIAAYPAVSLHAYSEEASRVSDRVSCNRPQLNSRSHASDTTAEATLSRWAQMTPCEAATAFIDANPKTGGIDGNARRKGASWDKKTREQFKLSALLLDQIMEGRPLSSISDDDLLDLNRHFQRLHGPSFRKSERQRAMSITDIATETDGLVAEGKLTQEEVGFGIGTTNRHWGFLRKLTQWFSRKHPLADLNYSAFIEEDVRNPREQRDVYSTDEGRMLFSLPPWTGCKSLQSRLTTGAMVFHDASYFVPLIAWYTGLRRKAEAINDMSVH